MPSHRVEPERPVRPRGLNRRAFGSLLASVAAVSTFAGVTPLLFGRRAAPHPRPSASQRPTSMRTTSTTIHANGTDQTAAIRQWLAEPSAGGVKRMVGSFHISSTLAPAAHARLDLRAATITLAPRANTTMLALAAGGIHVDGGHLIGRSRQQSGGGTAIAITADDCRVTGTRIDDAYRSGIAASGANRLVIEHVRVTGSGDNGIFVEAGAAACSDVSILGCTVDRSHLAPSAIHEGGIKVHGGASTTVSRLVLRGCAVVLPKRPADYACVGIEVWYSPGALLAANRTTAGWSGVSVAVSPGATVRDGRVTNALEYGIELAASTRSRVTGNTVVGGSVLNDGISLTSAINGRFSDGALIRANTVSGCTRTGIASLGASGITLDGNTLIDAVGGYLINLISSRSATISGNLLDGAGEAQRCVMIDTCSNVSVTDNTLQDVSDAAVYLYSGQRGYVLQRITLRGNRISAVGVPLGSATMNGARLGTAIVLKSNSGLADSGNWGRVR